MICLFSLCLRNIYCHSLEWITSVPHCSQRSTCVSEFQNFEILFFPDKHICFIIVFSCPQIIAAWLFSAHEANIDLSRLPTNGPVQKHRSNADCFLHVWQYSMCKGLYVLLLINTDVSQEFANYVFLQPIKCLYKDKWVQCWAFIAQFSPHLATNHLCSCRVLTNKLLPQRSRPLFF